MGKYWYNNKEDIDSAESFIRNCSKGSKLSGYVNKCFYQGEIIKREKNNPLMNHAILRSAKNNFFYNSKTKSAEEKIIKKYLNNLIKER